MADEPKDESKYLNEALEVMSGAGWLHGFGEDAHGFAVEYTEKGEAAFTALRGILNDLGQDNVTRDVWWAIRAMAVLKG